MGFTIRHVATAILVASVQTSSRRLIDVIDQMSTKGWELQTYAQLGWGAARLGSFGESDQAVPLEQFIKDFQLLIILARAS